MLVACALAKRDAEQLPSLFRKWDNDSSLNGDGWGHFIDGKWIRAVEGQHPGVPWVSYSDPTYSGDAYYAKGHHPRSFWARYIWVGWRNRASKMSRDLGIMATKRNIKLLAGTLDINSAKEGYFLLQHGDEYHYKSAKRIGPFMMIRSLGFKLEIRYKMYAEEGLVAAVFIPFSAKRAKK